MDWAGELTKSLQWLSDVFIVYIRPVGNRYSERRDVTRAKKYESETYESIARKPSW
jgi:hypothetical protein